ncbi:MAG: hypothetical protein FJ213_13150 [Ignavibacteria bacterium]|nr:hypothetical protein [Ignavibacteria bacterium]
MTKKILFTILCLFQLSFGQKIDPNLVIEKIREQFGSINDYTADVSVKVDIEYLKVPDINAKVYFKKPDMIHIESKGFALLPKQGLNFSPDALFEKKFTAIYENDAEIDNQTFHIIKVIPEESERGPSIITLYVNSRHYTIGKIITLGERSGKVEVNLDHKLVDNKYWLPEKVDILLDVGNLRFGRRRQSPKETLSENKTEEKQEGRVTLTYSNYIVNKGIDDKIFEKKENER